MMHCVLQLIVIGLVVLMLIFEPYHENCGHSPENLGAFSNPVAAILLRICYST